MRRKKVRLVCRTPNQTYCNSGGIFVIQISRKGVIPTPLKIPIHLRSQIRELIPLCCNHTDGHCLLLGGPCAQALSESRIVCKYFRDFVLPGEPELCKEIIQ